MKKSEYIFTKIEIKHIYKSYNIQNKKLLTVLNDINLSIKENDFIVILGKSGCGKSTLLNIIAGLLQPSSGEVRVDNKIICKPHPSRSILFQEPSLLPWLNVEENIAFGCKIRGELEHLEYRVLRFIELMGLRGFEKSHPTELSIGMAHRVCLARAFIGLPEILLLDEPFGALDTFTRFRIQDVLKQRWQEKKFTAVFVTHDIDEAITLGTKIVLLGNVPCQILDIIDIGYDFVKDITSQTFIDIRDTILNIFKNDLTNN